MNRQAHTAVIVFALTLAASSQSLAQSCFAGRSTYFRPMAEARLTSRETIDIMSNGCEELGVIPHAFDAPTIRDRFFEGLSVFSFTMMGQAVAAFDRLDRSEAQLNFKTALEQIKQEPRPLTRIKKVYELVAKTQGFYDSTNGGASNVISGYYFAANAPGNLIDQAQKRGTVGVCREMASLLQWSLMQVSRDSKSTAAGLGPNDFSSELIGGLMPQSGEDDGKKEFGHAWVRVNLPIFNSQGFLTGFDHFDLDTTFYPEVYSPLFPRHSGLTPSTRSMLLRQCQEIQACLQKQGD